MTVYTIRCQHDIKTLDGNIYRHGCVAPMACGTFGYCRQRNIDAGCMSNVTPELQDEWRAKDKLA